MKAALVAESGELVIDEVAIPEISEDEVLVEVKYCGICGSDLYFYRKQRPVKRSIYPGHEFSGVIAEVGKSVRGWKPGERVAIIPVYICGECSACRRGRHRECEHKFENCIGIGHGRANAGAYAKFVKVSIPEWRLHRLPDGVSFEEGALVEPLACSLNGVKISGLRVGEHTMVLGAGPIGLGVIAFLKYAGAGLIIVQEIVEKRAELAKKLGADYVFNPQKTLNLKEKVFELTNGKGVDVVFDCSGVAQVFLGATGYLRYGGRVTLLGIVEGGVSVTPGIWVMREWSILASGAYGLDEFPVAIDFLKKGISPIKEMVTSKIKLSNLVKEGFEVLCQPGHNEIKILVEPDE